MIKDHVQFIFIRNNKTFILVKWNNSIRNDRTNGAVIKK
jgi:hypothetical protein